MGVCTYQAREYWYIGSVYLPCQRILVHGVYVGEVGDREEEDGGVDGDGCVAHPSRVDLLLRLLRDRLLLRDLVRQNLRETKTKSGNQGHKKNYISLNRNCAGNQGFPHKLMLGYSAVNFRPHDCVQFDTLNTLTFQHKFVRESSET